MIDDLDWRIVGNGQYKLPGYVAGVFENSSAIGVPVGVPVAGGVSVDDSFFFESGVVFFLSFLSLL